MNVVGISFQGLREDIPPRRSRRMRTVSYRSHGANYLEFCLNNTAYRIIQFTGYRYARSSFLEDELGVIILQHHTSEIGRNLYKN